VRYACWPMRSPKYPLEPLVELRQKTMDAAARELVGAARERLTASAARQAAEQRREDHERTVSRDRAAEGEALARGELLVADLARADAWGLRVGADMDILAAGVDRARTAEARAGETESRARSAVISRRAEAQVLAQHKARWAEAIRKDIEAKDDEASSEAQGMSPVSRARGRNVGRRKR
jgi:hypothetical protein